MKAQVVNVEYGFQPLRDFSINAGVVDKDAGVHEIRLPLSLAATQARQQTVGLHQSHSRLRQANSISIPERKLAANQIWVIQNRVEPRCLSVGRIGITLCPKE